MAWFFGRTRQKKSRKKANSGVRRLGNGQRQFESLEDRLALSIDTWTGVLGANWSTNISGVTNWSGAVPVNGDSLIFPSGASNPTNNDDIANLSVSSVTFNGSSGGYNLGGSDALTITTGVTDSNTSGTDIMNMPLVLGGSDTADVASGAQLNLGGVISGSSGSISKTSAGTLDLLGANTYGGGTTVSAGTLLADGTIGAVTLSGGTLGGIGTTGAIIATGGTLSPGDANSPGVLTSGAVTLNSSTTFNAVIDGTTAGNGAGFYGQLLAKGNVNLGGATLTASLGVPLSSTTAFTLIQSTGTISGTFAQGTSLTINGQRFQITYNPTSVVLTPANTTDTLVSSANPSQLNQSVTLTATVAPANGLSGTPTGTVNFFDNNGTTLLGSGTLATVNGHQQATFSTSTLAAGTHSITAFYSGDSNFNASTSSTLSQKVTAIGTTISLSTPQNAVSPGQSITLTALVASSGSGTPTGTVNFFDGSTLIGSASLTTVNGHQQATFSTSSLAVGNRQLSAQYAGNSTFSSSTSSTLLEFVGNTNERYVNQVYVELLGRDAETQAINYWSSALTAGLSPIIMAQRIEGSSEFHIREINSVYSAYLDRLADSAAISNFNQLMTEGYSISYVKAVVLGSDEYFNLHGGTVNGFANALYNDLLGRNIDSGALTAIGLELPGGGNPITRATVAMQVMSKLEYQQVLIQSFYETYLGRSADTAGANYFISQLNSGATEEAIISQFVASQEFFNSIGP